MHDQVLFRLDQSPSERLYRREGLRWRTASLPRCVQRFAENADLTDDHLGAAVLWFTMGAVATTAAALLAGGVQAAVLAAAVIGLPLAMGKRWSGRRNRRLIAELPDIVELIGRSLRSGASLTQALVEAVTDGPATAARELTVVVTALERGQPASTTLRAWVARTAQPEVRIVAAALALASNHEAGTTQALDGVSHSLRDRAALQAEIRSHSAQAAASVQALVLLPMLFVLLDALGSQTTLQFLLREPAGQLCLGGAVLLNALGWWWMASIIRRRARQ